MHDLCFPMTDDLPRLRFKCPFCTHTVKRRADLKRHLRCHTGERPYPCEACGKRFTRLEHLRNHFQTVWRLGGLWESAGFHWCHCSAVAGTSTITMSVLWIGRLSTFVFENDSGMCLFLIAVLLDERWQFHILTPADTSSWQTYLQEVQAPGERADGLRCAAGNAALQAVPQLSDRDQPGGRPWRRGCGALPCQLRGKQTFQVGSGGWSEVGWRRSGGRAVQFGCPTWYRQPCRWGRWKGETKS